MPLLALMVAAGACKEEPAGPTVGEEWRDRLLFTAFDSVGGEHLSSMQPDGSDARPIFPSGGGVNEPDLDWRHERLVYASGNWPGTGIHVWSLAKGTSTRLTAPEDSSLNAWPVWSPDGKRIAFASTRDGDFEIYVMNANGSDVVQLTDNDAQDDIPSWSPDGRRLAFVSDRDGNMEIYVMNADGSGQMNLTNNPGLDLLSSHAWSPDGSRILFNSYRDGLGESWLFVMASDGSGVTMVADTLSTLTHATWSPDGNRVAFTGSQDFFQFDIFVMNLDGTGLVNLSSDSGQHYLDQWIR